MKAGAVVGQVAVEGIVDRLGRADRHHGRGEVGTPDPFLAAGLGHHHGVGDGHAERRQPVGQGEVAGPAVLPEPDQLGAERAAVVFDEVHQHVHAPRPHRPTGHLAPGDQRDAELVGPAHGPARRPPASRGRSGPPPRSPPRPPAPGSARAGRCRPTRRSGCAGRSSVSEATGPPVGAPAGDAGRGRPARLEWHGEAVVWPNRGERRDPTTPGVCGDQPMMEAKEACGVFGVYAPGRSVAHLTFDGLYALQHRGQESAGMAVSDGDAITVMKDMGLVTTVFDERKLSGLRGHMAIGHTRYSTAGSSDWLHAQPVFRGVGRAGFGLAHNGNLTNTTELWRVGRDAPRPGVLGQRPGGRAAGPGVPTRRGGARGRGRRGRAQRRVGAGPHHGAALGWRGRSPSSSSMPTG